jgi:acyl-CoA thioester hydrolase
MPEPFAVRVQARGYETDSNGHVAGTVLLQYGLHARWECLRAAGVDQHRLLELGYGPVSLEERIRFHREVRAGDELEVTCAFVWGEGKTFRVVQEVRCAASADLVGEITNVGGLLDLGRRAMVEDPAAVWRLVASAPGLLGLG